ncbi:MAG: energy transducer TonB [Bacteroidota bacterium]
MKRYVTTITLLFFSSLLCFGQEADESSTKTTEGNQVFMHVDLPAEFSGGSIAENKYLGQNLIVPENVGDVNGKVFFEFIVEKDGSLSDIKMIRGLVPSVDKVAMDVVKNMPKWEPAFKNGVPVRQRMQYSIMVRRVKKQ